MMVAAACPLPNRRRETRPARDELAIVIGNLESATKTGVNDGTRTVPGMVVGPPAPSQTRFPA
jgi:hypothetical protein